MTIDKAQGDT